MYAQVSMLKMKKRGPWVWLELDTVVSPEGVIGLPRATDTGDKGV